MNTKVHPSTLLLLFFSLLILGSCQSTRSHQALLLKNLEESIQQEAYHQGQRKVKIYLQQGVELYGESYRSRHFLTFLFQNKRFDLIDILLSHYQGAAQIRLLNELYLRAARYDAQFFFRLIQEYSEKISLWARNINNENALFLAVRGGQYAVVCFFLNSPCSNEFSHVNLSRLQSNSISLPPLMFTQSTYEGKNIFVYAIQSQSNKIFYLLWNYYQTHFTEDIALSDWLTPDQYGLNLFFYSVLYDNPSSLKHFLQEDSQATLGAYRDKNQKTIWEYILTQASYNLVTVYRPYLNKTYLNSSEWLALLKSKNKTFIESILSQYSYKDRLVSEQARFALSYCIQSSDKDLYEKCVYQWNLGQDLEDFSSHEVSIFWLKKAMDTLDLDFFLYFLQDRQWSLSAQTDDNGWNLLSYSTVLGSIDLYQFFLQQGFNLSILDKQGRNLYALAQLSGDPKWADYIKNQGLYADLFRIDNYETNVLSYAIDINRDIYDFNIIQDVHPHRGFLMNSLLHQSVFSPDIELWKSVSIDFNLDINLPDSAGRSPFLYAIFRYDRPLASFQAMKEYGADLSLVSYNGDSALMYAAQVGRKDLMEWLITEGLDLKMKNKQGLGILHFAASSNQLSLVKWLIEEKELKAHLSTYGLWPSDLSIEPELTFYLKSQELDNGN